MLNESLVSPPTASLCVVGLVWIICLPSHWDKKEGILILGFLRWTLIHTQTSLLKNERCLKWNLSGGSPLFTAAIWPHGGWPDYITCWIPRVSTLLLERFRFIWKDYLFLCFQTTISKPCSHQHTLMETLKFYKRVDRKDRFRKISHGFTHFTTLNQLCSHLVVSAFSHDWSVSSALTEQKASFWISHNMQKKNDTPVSFQHCSLADGWNNRFCLPIEVQWRWANNWLLLLIVLSQLCVQKQLDFAESICSENRKLSSAFCFGVSCFGDTATEME